MGTTSRMGLDATRGPDFEGVKAALSEQAMARAAQMLARMGRQGTPLPICLARHACTVPSGFEYVASILSRAMASTCPR